MLNGKNFREDTPSKTSNHRDLLYLITSVAIMLLYKTLLGELANWKLHLDFSCYVYSNAETIFSHSCQFSAAFQFLLHIFVCNYLVSLMSLYLMMLSKLCLAIIGMDHASSRFCLLMSKQESLSGDPDSRQPEPGKRGDVSFFICILFFFIENLKKIYLSRKLIMKKYYLLFIYFYLFFCSSCKRRTQPALA